MEREQFIKGIEILNGTARLRVSNDFMTVSFYDLTEGDDLLEFRGIEDELLRLGITHGILSVPFQKDDHWVVARGTEPVHGIDGRIELAEIHDNLFTGNEGDDRTGTRDPRELDTIVNVSRGCVVAYNIPPSAGIDGMNVFGEVVPARSGKWAAFNTGQGVEVADDGKSLKASVSGKFHVEGDKISVLDEYELESVDSSTGNIRFAGKRLTVKGSVNGGFKVYVRGDLIIKENVEDGASVEAGGSIEVGGLIRAGHTRVRAGIDLHCEALEYAELSARGNIRIDDYMLDAVCKAGGDVIMESGKGLVAGGKVLLGGSFRGLVTGTPANVPTMIHAGFNPQVKQMHDRLVEEMEDCSAKSMELGKALEKLEIMEQRHPLSEKLEKVKEGIESGLEKLRNASEDQKEMLEALEAQLGMLSEATITVHNTAYPNTIIRICNAKLLLKKEVGGVRFSFRRGQIVLTTTV